MIPVGGDDPVAVGRDLSRHFGALFEASDVGMNSDGFGVISFARRLPTPVPAGLIQGHAAAARFSSVVQNQFFITPCHLCI